MDFGLLRHISTESSLADFQGIELHLSALLELPLREDPTDLSVHYNLGILYDDDLDDKQKARAHYEKFLELGANERDAAKVREWLLSL